MPAAAAGRMLVVEPACFMGLRWLPLRSGTAASPVALEAAWSLTLLTVAR